MSRFHQLSLGNPMSDAEEVPDSYASISASLLYPSIVPVIEMRIADVVSGENVNCVHTLRFPVTAAPGTSSHWVPVQYCTWNAVVPYKPNVVLSVGSTGVR